MKISIVTLSLLLSLSSLTEDQTTKQLIIISTSLGEIGLELYPDKAPISVANFLEYVDGGYFENSSFYRSVTMDNQAGNDIKIEVIQGGLSGTGKRPDIDPIAHETTEVSGIRHLDGTISMARSGPGSASSEFFICINDQPSLDFGGMRNPDGQGFAAFGKVTRGMDVVRSIQNSEYEGQNLNPPIKIENIISVVIGIRKKDSHMSKEEQMIGELKKIQL